MTTKELSLYLNTLKPVRGLLSNMIQQLIKEAEKDRKRAKNGSQYYADQKMKMVEDLRRVQASYDQMIRVLKEEVENNEAVQMAQTEEIVRLTEQLEMSATRIIEVSKLAAVNNGIASMIIKEDFN